MPLSDRWWPCRSLRFLRGLAHNVAAGAGFLVRSSRAGVHYAPLYLVTVAWSFFRPRMRASALSGLDAVRWFFVAQALSVPWFSSRSPLICLAFPHAACVTVHLLPRSALALSALVPTFASTFHNWRLSLVVARAVFNSLVWSAVFATSSFGTLGTDPCLCWWGFRHRPYCSMPLPS